MFFLFQFIWCDSERLEFRIARIDISIKNQRTKEEIYGYGLHQGMWRYTGAQEVAAGSGAFGFPDSYDGGLFWKCGGICQGSGDSVFLLVIFPFLA
jgi:hypothetical protein